jgi:Fe-S cluster assembly protein SufD
VPQLVDGVSIDRLSECASAPAVFDAFAPRRTEAFLLFADAYFDEAIVVTVAPHVVIDTPIVIVHEITPGGVPAVVFPRIMIEVGTGAVVDVIELCCSDHDVCLAVPMTEIAVADDATCSYLGVQQLGRKTWQIGTQSSRVGTNARFSSFSAAFGGDYARLAIDSRLDGEGATSELLAVYYGDETQVQDFRTYQEHAAPHTKSELVFKGAVADSARSVYTGLIRIERGAVGSNAAQTNRNLVLSEGAHADSVPNLDIAENDVRCTHASAVGPIDAEQRFYLESRGVPTEVAEQLILLGYFKELFARTNHPAIAAYLGRALEARLTGVTVLPAPREELERAGAS